MPQGIAVSVDNGFAQIDFMDPALRGPALQRLLDIGGPSSIETLTRVKGSPRRQYRVPEGNAREAGLIDDVTAELDVSGTDTGASAALVDADPNRGASVAGADGPAAKDDVNFHAPVDQYTSANSFVGQVPNDEVLAGRAQVHTGDAGSSGGSGNTTLHSDVIGHVLDSSSVRAVGGVDPNISETVREPVIPASVISGALAEQTAALGSDPGGYAAQGPNVPVAPHQPVTAPVPETSPGTTGVEPGVGPRPEGIPDGEPDDTWKRAELETYAVWKGVENASDLPNKAAVLDAIKGKEQL